MWVTRRFDRARRRLRPAGSSIAPAGAVSPHAAAPAAGRPVDAAPPEPDAILSDLVVSVVRSDLESVITGLAAATAPDAPRPDSPVQLAGALAAFISSVGGAGRPSVTRSPAGLYTPEYWHIRVEDADERTRDAVGRLCAGGRIR